MLVFIAVLVKDCHGTEINKHSQARKRQNRSSSCHHCCFPCLNIYLFLVDIFGFKYLNNQSENNQRSHKRRNVNPEFFLERPDTQQTQIETGLSNICYPFTVLKVNFVQQCLSTVPEQQFSNYSLAVTRHGRLSHALDFSTCGSSLEGMFCLL